MTNIIKSWNSKTIRIREDKYVCLTDMAQATGKLVANWTRNKETQEYLNELSSVMRISVTDLVQVIQGGKPQDQGTWGHPKIALRFAQWCNPKFAVQVDFWIDELLTTGKVELAKPLPKKAIQHYAARVADIRKNLHKPQGTWCIIEKCCHLLLEVENVGYNVDQFDLLDGSVGKHWANYRRLHGINNPVSQASYLVPQSPHPVSIAAYSNTELGIFSEWLETIYEKSAMTKYLKGKYGALVRV